MKKFYMILLCLFSTLSMIAQSADPVSSDLQEKTKRLETQVRSIQHSNATLNNDLSGVKITVDSLSTMFVTGTDFDAYAQVTNSQIKRTDRVILKVKKVIKYYKLMAVGTIGLFLLLLVYLISVKNSLSKKLQNATNLLDDMGNTVSNKGEATDKKLAELSAALAKANDAIAKLEKKEAETKKKKQE